MDTNMFRNKGEHAVVAGFADLFCGGVARRWDMFAVWGGVWDIFWHFFRRCVGGRIEEGFCNKDACNKPTQIPTTYANLIRHMKTYTNHSQQQQHAIHSSR